MSLEQVLLENAQLLNGACHRGNRHLDGRKRRSAVLVFYSPSLPHLRLHANLPALRERWLTRAPSLRCATASSGNGRYRMTLKTRVASSRIVSTAPSSMSRTTE